MVEVGKITKIPLAKIYAASTFYSSLHVAEIAKFLLELCTSPPCYLNNSIDIIKKVEKNLKMRSGETSSDKKFTFFINSCISCCDWAPAMRNNGKLHGNLTKSKVKKILDGLKNCKS